MLITDSVRVVFSEKGAVVLDIDSGKYFALNDVGSRIWRRLSAGESRDEVVKGLVADFGGEVPVERVSGDVDAFVSMLSSKGFYR